MIEVVRRASAIASAARRVDASRVELHGCRVDSDRDGPVLGKSSLDVRLALLALGHLRPSLDERERLFDVSRFATSRASPSGGIFVVLLRRDSVFLDVDECILLKSSVASLV